MKKILTRLAVVFFYMMSILPFAVLYFLSDLSFVIVFYVIGYRKKIVLANLTNSFPNKNLTISRKSIRKRIVVKNLELVQEYFAKHKSLILYMGHYGNWEWLAALSIYVPHQMVAFYQPLSDALFDKLIKTSRERFGLIAVRSNQGYKSLVDFANRNILTCTLALGDQNPPGQSNMHWVTFLNQETAFLTGVDRIAKKMDMVVLFPLFRKTARGFYEIELKVIQENMKEIESFQIIENYAKLLELAIIQDPSLWLWSHRRWKRKKPLSTNKAD
jgi:KDO2-lipid IV(A) lauroyltransferase